jgi:hypothetical protein
LDYFNAIGVSVDSAVCCVVITHWHDDHIRGISKIIESATKAELVISGALRNNEFLTLVSLNHPRGGPRGLKEMAEVLRIMDSRIVNGMVRKGVNFKFAHENTTLLRIDNPVFVQLTSLSPSSAAVALGLQEFAKLNPAINSPVNDIVQGANDVAVVLHVKAGNRTLLLGSDLECNIDSRCGWQVIADSTARPSDRAEVFKVPHHGSNSGYEERIWKEMLIENVQAILTPFRRLPDPLPTKNDITRILSLTNKAFLTADPHTKAPLSRNTTVDKIVKSTVLARTVREDTTTGHIRLRAKLTGAAEWRVELFNGAISLYNAA